MLFHQQPLRIESPPTAFLRQMLHPLRGSLLRESCLARRFFSFRHNSKNTAEMNWLVEPAILALLAQISRERNTMLDVAVMKIDDVKRAIRSRAKANRTKPFIG